MISFDNDPRLKDISPIKLRIIKEIAGRSSQSTVEQMLPEIMQINRELKNRNLSFTKKESELIIDILMNQMPDEDRKKIALLKGLM
jgi:hypothetical protein